MQQPTALRVDAKGLAYRPVAYRLTRMTAIRIGLSAAASGRTETLHSPSRPRQKHAYDARLGVGTGALNANAGGGCPGSEGACEPMPRAGANARAARRRPTGSRVRAGGVRREYGGGCAPSARARVRARGAR